MWHTGKIINATKLYFEDMKKGDHFGDVSIYERILTSILQQQSDMMWITFI
jgi:hypothetical protein